MKVPMTGSDDTSPLVRPFPKGRVFAALVVLAALLTPAVGANAQNDPGEPVADERSATGPAMLPGEMVIETIDPRVDAASAAYLAGVDEIRAEQRLRLAHLERSLPARQAASNSNDITVTYVRTTPADVREVVEAAVADWNAVLVTSSTGPVEISFDWVDLSQSLPGTLGFAGPTGFFRRTDGLYYPVALANNLDGRDYTPGSVEIEVTISSYFYNRPGGWFVDATSATVPSNRLDLYATMLHEVGHGLGFLGSAERRNGVDRLQSPPDRYDTLVRYQGARLVDLPNSGALLTSQDLFIDIGGGVLHELYAPSQFFNGSSYSHFDEVAYQNGAPGSLMTPALGSGETERVIDAPTLGVLIQSGWTPEVDLLEPDITTVTEHSGAFTVAWTVDLADSSVPPQSYRVRAVRRNGGQVDADVAVSGTTRSVRLNGLTNGVSYRLEVSPVGFGDSPGATTVNQTLTPPPGPPSLIAVGGSGFNRPVTWRLTDNGGSPVLRYEVEVSKNGAGFTRLGNTSNTSINSGRLSNDIYQFRVRAVTNNGAGEYGYSLPIGFTNSVVRPLPLDGEIARLYQAYFDRLPDQGGMDYYRQVRADGRSLASVSQEFLGSPEFVATYGNLDSQAFIEQLYRNVLGREGDATGINFWTNRLRNGQSRSAVVIEFSQSTEFVEQTGTAGVQTSIEGSVYRLYLAYFLRPADSGGFAFYTNQATSRSLGSISNDFAVSPEFVERYGALTDREFLDLIYANVLSRTPDDAGYAFWVDQMQRGTTRGDVMLAFSESPEFVVRTGTTP